ncbi:general secretion pathway protein GspB [Pseudomaricurvus alkylphenolicus]|jgi:MSHA biogenesis protein MshK|uniref:general secretion pathway protein GspB n=1 Tax=Pseudomaricurvus alkylphenolicus TaxID=1306991 RepID=UPI00141E2EC2|nr:general secretion pathway protein GspB [Pseudomaricurvus alkylphenolicus]NIB44385.1 general secretion pathway protein GspB [Pseudomaricurvus alkylphenolicus]
MRDPTRPLKYSAPISSQQQQALKLHSVLISSQRKLAVINGKTVRENQWVDGARVVSILPGKVLLSVRGRQQELRLKAKVRN